MSEVKTGDEVMTEEEQAKANSREHLWRAALWAGFAHGEMIIESLRASKTPWYSELGPLTTEERVFVIAQICKYYFPDMTGDNEAQAFKMLGKLYGVKKNRIMRRVERQYGN